MSDGLAALSILAWLAYGASRLLARRNVPELVGFLIVGAALGPSGFEILDSGDLTSLRPATEIALAVLMFMIGERVSRRALRAARWAVTAGLVQYVLAGALVFVATRMAGADRSVSLLLGALAGAGAPMTIASVAVSTRARGRYVSGLISTHALKDALAATTFAAVLPFAQLLEDETVSLSDAFVRFARLGAGGIVLGVAFGWLISRFGFQIETSGELLLFVLVHILVGWTVATELEISLPLGALVAGAVSSSLSPADFSTRLFRTIKTIEQPLYLLFFALAGASIHLEDVPDVGLIGIVYILVRAVGQLGGGILGGFAGGLRGHDSVRLGIDSFPQAGVAVGLAVLASETLAGPGVEAATIVLGSVVIAEFIGPLVVARGLAGKPRAVDEQVGHRPPWLEHEPEVVILASQEPLRVPDWLIGAAGRWGSRIVALLPGGEDASHADELRSQAQAAHCDLQTRRWIPGESFTGAVVRLQEEVGAHLVVLVARRPVNLGSTSRLVLLPHERIARQLRVPVLTLPLDGTGSGPAPAAPVSGRRSLLDRILRRSPPTGDGAGTAASTLPPTGEPGAPAPVTVPAADGEEPGPSDGDRRPAGG